MRRSREEIAGEVYAIAKRLSQLRFECKDVGLHESAGALGFATFGLFPLAGMIEAGGLDRGVAIDRGIPEPPK